MHTIPLIIFICPIISILLGIIGYITLKKIYPPVFLVVIVGIIATFVWFNSTFTFWIFIYAFLAFAAAFATKVITTKHQQRSLYGFK